MTPEELKKLQEDPEAMDKLAELEAAQYTPTETQVRQIAEGAPEQPSIPQQLETEQNNEQAKSPNQKTKQELLQDEAKKSIKSPLEELIAKSNALRENSASEIKAARSDDNRRAMLANAVKALGSMGSAKIQQDTGIDVGLKGFKPVKPLNSSKDISSDRDAMLKQMQEQYKLLQSGKKEGMTPFQKASLDLATRKQDLAAAKKAKPVELSKSELEVKKSKLKEDAQLRKENRTAKKGAEKSIIDIDKNIKNIDKAAKMMKDLTKNRVADTGPMDQYVTGSTDAGQNLRQAFNELSLAKMVKMFEGMSKAIDSESDRKFFQDAQASLGNYPAVNMRILKEMKERLESKKREEQGIISSFDKEGKPVEAAPTNEVKRRTKDGRSAIFNADTKEFIRYE